MKQSLFQILAIHFHKAMLTTDQLSLYSRIGETMQSDSVKSEVLLTIPADADFADLVPVKRQFEMESFAGWPVRFIESEETPPSTPALPYNGSQPQP